MDSIARSTYGNSKAMVVAGPCGSEGDIVGSGATTVVVTVAETSSVGVTVRGGSDEAMEDRIISVVPVTGVAMVGARTRSLGGVG